MNSFSPAKRSNTILGKTKNLSEDFHLKAACYYTLVGSVINQAIHDYKKIRFTSDKECGLAKAERKRIFRDAKDFLFTSRLDKFLIKSGIHELVRIDKIRKEAQAF